MDIPEFKLELVPLSDEAEKVMGFQWADPDVGTRSKLGGQPEGISAEDAPVCPSCSETMTFLCQIDSVGDDLVFADVGIVYVYICFGCFEAKAFVNGG